MDARSKSNSGAGALRAARTSISFNVVEPYYADTWDSPARYNCVCLRLTPAAVPAHSGLPARAKGDRLPGGAPSGSGWRADADACLSSLQQTAAVEQRRG